MKTLILSLVFFLILSCSKSDDSFKPQNITPVLIGKGILTGNNIYSEQNFVISNFSDWQILLNNFNASDTAITTTFSNTNIDFNNYQLLVAIDVENSSTTIDITNVIENENNISVTVQNLQLGLTDDIAKPFHIVQIPISTKPVVFQ